MLRTLALKRTGRTTAGYAKAVVVSRDGHIPRSFAHYSTGTDSEPPKPPSSPPSRASLWVLAATTVVLIANGYIWAQNGFKPSLTSSSSTHKSSTEDQSTPVHTGASSSPSITPTTTDSPYSNTNHDRYASPSEVQQAIAKLRELLPGEGAVATDPDELQSYGSSENSYHPTSPHAVVVRPRSTEDVVKIVDVAREYRVPITAYSGATSLEGHFAGVSAVSLSSMPGFWW